MPSPLRISYDALPSSPLPSPLPQELMTTGQGGTSCLESPQRESFVVHGQPNGADVRAEVRDVPLFANGSKLTVPPLLFPPAPSRHSREQKVAADAQVLRSTLRSLDKRQLRYTLILLALFLIIFYRTFISSIPLSPRISSPTLSQTHNNTLPRILSPTLVGPRPRTAPDGKPLYAECSADELLLAIKGAVVREDGPSRFPNATKQESVAIKQLPWSFDLAEVPDDSGQGTKSCGVPHVYTAEEACELLGAFGGIYNTGDSFSRHIHHALLIILRNRNDGGVVDYETTDDCREEQAFSESLLCRFRVPADTELAPVCGGLAHMHYVWWLRPELGVADEMLKQYTLWRASLPKQSQALSPVFIPSIGVHFNYTAEQLFPEWLPKTLDYFSRQYPVPLHLFAGPHAPPHNQNPLYRSTQGRPRVQQFKEEVELQYRTSSMEQKGERGGPRYFDTYAMTDGAASFDGAHMGYVPNTEKAQLILNVLDLWWADIVRHGGLVQRD
ncbi:hypothetical protein JCM11251_006837 [Rhodosporidiobolus azoricus]